MWTWARSLLGMKNPNSWSIMTYEWSISLLILLRIVWKWEVCWHLTGAGGKMTIRGGTTITILWVSSSPSMLDNGKKWFSMGSEKTRARRTLSSIGWITNNLTITWCVRCPLFNYWVRVSREEWEELPISNVLRNYGASSNKTIAFLRKAIWVGKIGTKAKNMIVKKETRNEIGARTN